MSITEKYLPKPIQPDLAAIEAWVARQHALDQAKRAYAYKNTHDNFSNQKRAEALPYDGERTIGRIATLQAFNAQGAYIPPSF